MGSIGLSGYASKNEQEGMEDEGRRILARGTHLGIIVVPEREALLRVQDRTPGHKIVLQELTSPREGTWTKNESSDKMDSTKIRYNKTFSDILNI